jgi:hypothetical protein
MVRALLPVFVILIVSGCSADSGGPRATLGPDPQGNSWVPAVVPASNQASPAPSEARDSEDCLRSSSVMALWNCTHGKVTQ